MCRGNKDVYSALKIKKYQFCLENSHLISRKVQKCYILLLNREACGVLQTN